MNCSVNFDSIVMIHMDIKVSVYCIVYNHEKYIREALEGFIKQQTDFSFEVIVHDDASTDKTVEIIKEYELKYPEIIKPIFQKENQYSKGENIEVAFMLPVTHGKYIALCEGDDYWTDSRKLQKQYDYMEDHPECSLVAHRALTLNMNNGKFCDYTNYQFPDNKLTAEQIIENQTFFPTASMFFRKKYYENNRDFILSIRNFDYVAKILLATEGDTYVFPEIMSVYRKGTDGSWTERINNNSKKYYEHLRQSIDTLGKINIYRNFEFNEAIQSNILRREFYAEISIMNLKVLKDSKYSSLRKELPLHSRLILYIKKYFPFLYKYYKAAHKKSR